MPKPRHLAITPAREERFLKTLAETGSVAAACAASATEAHGPRAAKSSWQDHRRKHPEFAQAWDEALEAALGRVEVELHRRAMEPARTPVVNRDGAVIGHREDRMSSDRLLLRLASRLDPDSWAERRRQDVEVSGEVRHTSQRLELAPSDVLLLPETEQRQLIGLLEQIRDRKAGLDPDAKVELTGEDEHDDE